MPGALCTGGKQQLQLALRKGRPLPPRRDGTVVRPPLAGIHTIAARGNSRKKLKSIGVAGVAGSMDVPAVAVATEATKDGHDTAEGAAVAKDSQDAAEGAASAWDSLDAAEEPAADAAIDDMSLTAGPILSETSALDWATPGAALGPPRHDSSGPQQTLSTIGSHAAAAEQMRTQNRELQLETVRLRRAELEYETAKMQFQRRQAIDSNPGRPGKVRSSGMLCITLTC